MDLHVEFTRINDVTEEQLKGVPLDVHGSQLLVALVDPRVIFRGKDGKHYAWSSSKKFAANVGLDRGVLNGLFYLGYATFDEIEGDFVNSNDYRHVRGIPFKEALEFEQLVYADFKLYKSNITGEYLKALAEKDLQKYMEIMRIFNVPHIKLDSDSEIQFEPVDLGISVDYAVIRYKKDTMYRFNLNGTKEKTQPPIR